MAWFPRDAPLDYNYYEFLRRNFVMWPLGLVFFFALSSPQQNGPSLDQDFRAQKLAEIKIRQFKLNSSGQNVPALGQDFRAGKLPNIQIERMQRMQIDRMALPRGPWDASTCFTVRSYVFHRNDGQAPKL